MISRTAAAAAVIVQLLAASAPALAAPPAQSAPIAATAQAAGPVAYRIDPTHAQARVSWNHMGLSRPGATFETIEGVIRIDTADPTRSSVSVTIPVSGADTGVPALDAMFQGADFFDAARHPNITFQSRAVRFTGLGNRFQVEGDLTVRGVTRPVVLDAVLNGSGVHPMTGAPAVGFSASTTLKRSDFGLGVALPVVGDEIDVQITVEAVA
ncbi:YceI family protein [Brevundimonas sp.]|uniref:YceI family protein n=1 Tax=Brevundimonas sp. TaxID=1871086 RepID=UPI002FD94BB6